MNTDTIPTTNGTHTGTPLDAAKAKLADAKADNRRRAGGGYEPTVGPGRRAVRVIAHIIVDRAAQICRPRPANFHLKHHEISRRILYDVVGDDHAPALPRGGATTDGRQASKHMGTTNGRPHLLFYLS